MSVTLSTISTAVDQFNDIPDITFNSIDITEFVEEVEIYTNTPAVMIPTKLNAMASNIKSWLNDTIATPLEDQQNTFKNEVVVRTNTAMNAVETFMNDEVAGFVNTVFIPWANDAGEILSTASNLLETNVVTQMSQLQTDYTIHVQSQDAIIQQALDDILLNLAQYTSGAADSGYSVHQTNELLYDLTKTREIGFGDYKYTSDGQIAFAEEGPNVTHHIAYSAAGSIMSFGESMQIVGEPYPFVQHLKLDLEASTGSTSVEKIKAYDIFKTIDSLEVATFRATGHESNGEPATDLTILNNTSIPDVDNPELIIRRGTSNALLLGGIDTGDLVKISNLDGSVYNGGVVNQYGSDYETIMFTPNSSYCHDSNSSLTGFGVTADLNASGLDSDGGVYDDPTKCENSFEENTALLNDFSRSYEYAISGESYISDVSDGLTYKVYISADAGAVDSYAYTIDSNTTLGTGAIFNAVYDDGVSDVTITNKGTKYSDNTFARAFDLGAVDIPNSTETKAIATFTLVDGMIDSVAVLNGGAGYTGYWNVEVDAVPGADTHTHNLQLSQADVNLIMSGTSVVSTTVDAGHSHDITITWNEFMERFEFTAMTGDHTHPGSSGYTVNPTITVGFSTSTGSGAAGYVLLTEAGALHKVVITTPGSLYAISDTITITGGGESTGAGVQLSFAGGGINSVALSTQGTGYTDTTAKTVSVNIQNNAFNPSTISANIGDTISFTNLDIGAHTVTNPDGAFDSGDIPQNATFSYIVTKDTELTDKYDITDNNSAAVATLWVRENTVFVDIATSTGGGMRGIATVNASGNIINIAVDRPGKGYLASDSVTIIDVSGPGEGAYANTIANRSVAEVTVNSRGTGYSQDTEIIVFDPTGYPVLDQNGAEVGRTYGSGADLKAEITYIAVDEFCSDSAFGTELDCTNAGATWSPAVTVGEIAEVKINRSGAGYADVQLIINDPKGAGAGATVTPDINNVIEDIDVVARGSNYDNPIIIVTDPGGTVGTDSTNTVGIDFAGTVVLNNGIGGATIVEDWSEYIASGTRVIVLDTHDEPTGFGATGVVTLGSAGNVSNIVMTNPGTAYKIPVVIVAGPVNYTGASITDANTDLALYGPKGNTDDSPFSANNSAGSNIKNGVMVQWENYNGHTLNDSWEFTLQSWKKGTPDALVYESSRFDGAMNNMKGVITLKDVWDV
jgi:plastocyanin